MQQTRTICLRFYRRILLVLILVQGFVSAVQSAGAAQIGAKPRTPGLLIVAPQAFQGVLQNYVRYKQTQLPTTLVTLETALQSATGLDDAERLKRYLYATWQKQQIGYVLLVGDADVLPVRYMVLDRITPIAFDYAFYPSDLYYGDLARPDGRFDDWNGHKDDFHAAYFGEVRGEKNKTDPINYDQITYHPRVAVGRWPVSTVEETRLVANKTMTYENGLRRRDKAGQFQAALFGVGGWVDMRPHMEGMSTSLASRWNVSRFLYADASRNDNTPPPNEAQLIAMLNSGAGLVIHAGHGSDNTWEGCFNVTHLDRVRNADRLPVVVSAGCSTARFATLPPYEPYLDTQGQEHRGTDRGEVFSQPPPPPACYQTGRYNPTGLGEQLLRHDVNGAVAYIGCNTGSQPCGLTLVEGFARAVAQSPAPRLGDCWNQAIRYYYEKEHLGTIAPTGDWYPASIFFQGMKFMVFGDPSLTLPAGK